MAWLQLKDHWGRFQNISKDGQSGTLKLKCMFIHVDKWLNTETQGEKNE